MREYISHIKKKWTIAPSSAPNISKLRILRSSRRLSHFPRSLHAYRTIEHQLCSILSLPAVLHLFQIHQRVSTHYPVYRMFLSHSTSSSNPQHRTHLLTRIAITLYLGFISILYISCSVHISTVSIIIRLFLYCFVELHMSRRQGCQHYVLALIALR